MLWLVKRDLVTRWRSWLVIVVLAGMVGGASTAAVAGWRRTSTAASRFLEHQVSLNAYLETTLSAEEVADLPGVESVSGGDYFLLSPVDPDGTPRPELIGKVNPFSYDSPSMFRSFERSLVVEGRLPDPEEPLEVAIDEEMAELRGLRSGDRFSMQGYGFEQAEELFESLGTLEPEGPVFEFTATAIIRSPADIVQVEAPADVVYLGSAEVWLGPAFHRAHHGQDVASISALFSGVEGLTNAYELRAPDPGPARAAFEAALERADPEAVLIQDASDNDLAVEEAERRTDTEGLMLLGSGALVLVGGGIVLDQAIRRRIDDDRHERHLLRILGLDRRTANRTGAAIGAVVATAAAVATTLLAVGASALTPVGTARRAEIDPGVDLDLPVLLAGASATAIVVLSRVLLSWSRSSTRSSLRRTLHSPLTALADRSGIPAIITGARAASSRRAGAAARISVGAATTILVAGIGFSASAGALVDDPDAWGWTFDAVVGDGNDPAVGEKAERTMADDPDIEAWGLLHDLEEARLTGTGDPVDVQIGAIEARRGTIEPIAMTGTPPRDERDIALGAISARALGVGVGDEVTLDLGSGPTPLHVSGTIVLHLGFDAERIGEGAIMTAAGLRAVGAEFEPTYALARFRADADPSAVADRLRATWGNTVLTPFRTGDLAALDSVRSLPTAFGGFVSLVAAASLAMTLVMSIRRRRHDIAVLRTMGYTRRQSRADVTVHAIALVIPATVVGALAGAVASRVVWRITARALGAIEVQVLPLPALVLIVLGTAAMAVISASIPGRMASRVVPAEPLREEGVERP